jgi:hypothetical protein
MRGHDDGFMRGHDDGFMKGYDDGLMACPTGLLSSSQAQTHHANQSCPVQLLVCV